MLTQMDIVWTRLKSWHVLRPDVFGVPTTYCGRDAANHETTSELPSAKSCEVCLRSIARIADDASAA